MRSIGHRHVGSRSMLSAVVAVAALGAGYADLARGGVTVAPLVLVVAYCVAIPIAILRAGTSRHG